MNEKRPERSSKSVIRRNGSGHCAASPVSVVPDFASTSRFCARICSAKAPRDEARPDRIERAMSGTSDEVDDRPARHTLQLRGKIEPDPTDPRIC
jgi:hypothetical protein